MAGLGRGVGLGFECEEFGPESGVVGLGLGFGPARRALRVTGGAGLRCGSVCGWDCISFEFGGGDLRTIGLTLR